MNRQWMPFYFGDYLKDTMHLTTEQHGAYLLLLIHCWQHGHLPMSKKERATIALMSLKKWRFCRLVIEPFFNLDGTHKRISKELERVEAVILKRKISGAKGGFHSAIARAKMHSNGQAFALNNFKQLVPPNSSNRLDNHKVSKKEPSKEASPSEALLEVCKAKGWVE